MAYDAKNFRTYSGGLSVHAKPLSMGPQSTKLNGHVLQHDKHVSKSIPPKLQSKLLDGQASVPKHKGYINRDVHASKSNSDYTPRKITNSSTFRSRLAIFEQESNPKHDESLRGKTQVRSRSEQPRSVTERASSWTRLHQKRDEFQNSDNTTTHSPRSLNGRNRRRSEDCATSPDFSLRRAERENWQGDGHENFKSPQKTGPEVFIVKLRHVPNKFESRTSNKFPMGTPEVSKLQAREYIDTQHARTNKDDPSMSKHSGGHSLSELQNTHRETTLHNSADAILTKPQEGLGKPDEAKLNSKGDDHFSSKVWDRYSHKILNASGSTKFKESDTAGTKMNSLGLHLSSDKWNSDIIPKQDRKRKDCRSSHLSQRSPERMSTFRDMGDLNGSKFHVTQQSQWSPDRLDSSKLLKHDQKIKDKQESCKLQRWRLQKHGLEKDKQDNSKLQGRKLQENQLEKDKQDSSKLQSLHEHAGLEKDRQYSWKLRSWKPQEQEVEKDKQDSSRLQSWKLQEPERIKNQQDSSEAQTWKLQEHEQNMDKPSSCDRLANVSKAQISSGTHANASPGHLTVGHLRVMADLRKNNRETHMNELDKAKEDPTGHLWESSTLLSDARSEDPCMNEIKELAEPSQIEYQQQKEQRVELSEKKSGSSKSHTGVKDLVSPTQGYSIATHAPTKSSHVAHYSARDVKEKGKDSWWSPNAYTEKDQFISRWESNPKTEHPLDQNSSTKSKHWERSFLPQKKESVSVTKLVQQFQGSHQPSLVKRDAEALCEKGQAKRLVLDANKNWSISRISDGLTCLKAEKNSGGSLPSHDDNSANARLHKSLDGRPAIDKEQVRNGLQDGDVTHNGQGRYDNQSSAWVPNDDVKAFSPPRRAFSDVHPGGTLCLSSAAELEKEADRREVLNTSEGSEYKIKVREIQCLDICFCKASLLLFCNLSIYCYAQVEYMTNMDCNESQCRGFE